VVGCCEHGDERLGFIKCRDLLDWLRTCGVLEKDTAHTNTVYANECVLPEDDHVMAEIFRGCLDGSVQRRTQ
jgi:hypothetical protein